MRALLLFLAGVCAIAASAVMAITGSHHTFTVKGGAAYYGIVVLLLAGGVFFLIGAWSVLANSVNRKN